jgi:hypothetical protein
LGIREVSHWIKGIDTFNNLVFEDDLSIIVEIRRLGDRNGGVQMILNVIEEFSNWSGMEVKVVKSCGMWVGVKRDERLSLKLTFREQQLKLMTKDTRCGTWVSFSHWTGTGRIWSRESWRRRRRHVTNWNDTH